MIGFLAFYGVAAAGLLYAAPMLISGSPHGLSLPPAREYRSRLAVRWYAIGCLFLPMYFPVAWILLHRGVSAAWSAFLVLPALLLQSLCWLIAARLDRRPQPSG
jgi:hypothetical protein